MKYFHVTYITYTTAQDPPRYSPTLSAAHPASLPPHSSQTNGPTSVGHPPPPLPHQPLPTHTTLKQHPANMPPPVARANTLPVPCEWCARPLGYCCDAHTRTY